MCVKGKDLTPPALAGMAWRIGLYGRSLTNRTLTIARAHATGMNIVFARQGYAFAGTLPNNTQIKGDLESTNVWYKHLKTRRKTL